MATILVTGAAGFLGGWLIPRLLAADHRVIACLNPASSVSYRSDSKYYLEGIGRRCSEIRLDLSDFSAVSAVIEAEDSRPDAIIHMAAIGDVTVSLKEPLATFNASAVSSIHIFEAVRRSGRHVPIVSHTTDKVYGQNQLPFLEDMPLRPFHIYEAAKATQDVVGQIYARHYGMPIVTVRCANYFGGFDFNFGRIVPYCIRQCIKGEQIVLRSEGNFTRDFLYVEDAADINLMLLTRLLDKDTEIAGEVYNFSLELQVTVRDLVDRICRLMQQEPRVSIEGTAKHEIPDMRLDCEKARRTFGWTPGHTLEDGLNKTIPFYRDYFASRLE